MSDSTVDLVQQLLTPSADNVERFLDDMRHWHDGFISATAFGVAAANWPRVRELALAEWRQCLDDPDCEAMDSQLPVLGFYLAAANRDAGFLAPMLEGWHKEEEIRDRLFGDILSQDGPALWALMAEHSPAAIKQLEDASLSNLSIAVHESTTPLEALAVLVKHGVYDRDAFDATVRRYLAAHDQMEPDDLEDRLECLAALLADVGPGVFMEEARGWLSAPRVMRHRFDFPIIDLAGFEQLIAEPDSEKHWHAWERFVEIPEDARVAMEWMRRSPQDESDDFDDDSFMPETSPYDDYLPAQPTVRTEPKTGRNDPCPCGSGKKFKKCCGKPGSEMPA